MDKVKVFWITKSDLVDLEYTGELVGRFPAAEAENRRIELRDRMNADMSIGKHAYVSTRPLYVMPDGSLCTWQKAAPGAMTDADWLHGFREYVGPDGIALIVKLPNGRDWMVDSRASNCTMKDDHVHKCWVRHGDPRTGNVHVDKNGPTCAAGAGSILSGDYHGFLHHGFLTNC